jgi:hypothetical protein
MASLICRELAIRDIKPMTRQLTPGGAGTKPVDVDLVLPLQH